MDETTTNPESSSSKLIISVIVVVLVLLVGWALVKKSSGPKAETGNIKIGFIAPLTGDAAVYGEPGRNTVALATEEINKAGGINGRMLEVIYEDGKCNGQDAANAAQKLVNVDKVQAIIGGFCSGESLAAEPVATQGKVFLFSPGSSSPDLTGKSRFFARNYPSDASQGVVLADVLYTQENVKKVAFVQEQTDYALGIYKAFETRFTQLGGTIVKEEVLSKDNDFKTQLTKLKAVKAEALFVDTQTPAVTELILKQVQELKWAPRIVINDVSIGDPELLTKYAKLLENGLGAEFGTNPTNPKFQQLLSAYQAKYGAELPYQSYGQTEYDAVYILKDGLTAVGDSGEKLADWIRTVSGWQGASGLVTIRADGDLSGGHSPEIIMSGKKGPYLKEPAID